MYKSFYINLQIKIVFTIIKTKHCVFKDRERSLKKYNYTFWLLKYLIDEVKSLSIYLSTILMYHLHDTTSIQG